MRKRYHTIPRQPKKESTAEPQDSRPILKEKRKKSRKISWKTFLFSVALLFLIVIGYMGISSIKAANNILASDISFSSLVKQNNLKQEDGITNILLLGKGGSNHPGGQLTDTIIIARIRHDDKKIALLSIPRDLMVTLPGKGPSRVNEAYAQGSAGQLSSQASRLMPRASWSGSS